MVNDISINSWEEVSKEISLLPRGWFELAHLSREDRILFTREFWLLRLGDEISSVDVLEKLNIFFDNMEDISIYAIQHLENQGYEVRMVYSMRHAGFFFQGGPPAFSLSIEQLNQKFDNIFPKDYLAFMGIHDGFGNCEDVGIIPTKEMAKSYQKFQQFLSLGERKYNGISLDKIGLIPFYESVDLYSYQCFSMNNILANGGMANINFSSTDFESNEKGYTRKSCKFLSFLSWFVSYIEQE
ncbi:hypothetical protein CLAVI_000554 [Candidatus Clavichlamydia salmonicola]|nr:hypothetical protein [Candidatus Clavichlamydia salmonicola]